jgi:hypothetical protein
MVCPDSPLPLWGNLAGPTLATRQCQRNYSGMECTPYFRFPKGDLSKPWLGSQTREREK